MCTSLHKIVILGSDGFVGGAVFNSFKEKYGQCVVGITPGNIDLTRKDSSEKLKKHFNKDTVVVFISGITAEKDDSIQAFGQNIEMVVNVAQALEDNPAAKCIYLSTVSVYGSGAKTGPITEEHPIRLDSLYALAKYTGEKVLIRVSEAKAIPLVILRLPRIYGPEDVNSKYGPSAFIRQLGKRQDLVTFGNG
jgi:nucleoside-diphosphate-sugar epimerase